MTEREILNKIRKAKIVKRGNFKLRSGMSSNLYIDVRKLYGDPKLFFSIANKIKETLPDNATCVAGSGYGGLPIASAVALVSNKKLIAVRNEKKNHGISKLIEGHTPTSKDKIVIIDDLFMTGSSILSTAKILKKTGAKIIGARVIVQRTEPKNFPIQLKSLFRVKDFLK